MKAPAKPAAMVAKPFSIRLSVTERLALKKASMRDVRPMAVVARMAVQAWLQKEGFLKS